MNSALQSIGGMERTAWATPAIQWDPYVQEFRHRPRPYPGPRRTASAFPGESYLGVPVEHTPIYWRNQC